MAEPLPVRVVDDDEAIRNLVVGSHLQGRRSVAGIYRYRLLETAPDDARSLVSQ